VRLGTRDTGGRLISVFFLEYTVFKVFFCEFVVLLVRGRTCQTSFSLTIGRGDFGRLIQDAGRVASGPGCVSWRAW